MEQKTGWEKWFIKLVELLELKSPGSWCFPVFPKQGHPWAKGCPHKPKVDHRGQGFFVTSFSQVGKTALLTTSVWVTLKGEAFLLSFSVQSMAQFHFKTQALEVTLASLSGTAANGQRTSSGKRRFGFIVNSCLRLLKSSSGRAPEILSYGPGPCSRDSLRFSQ